MKSIRLFLASFIAIALVSCTNQKNDYDTTNPYGTPDGAATNNIPNPPAQPANPTYDTPAAYEESTSPPVSPEALNPTNPEPPAKDQATTRGATVHTVVKGDTLGGIAGKYKVSISSIKKANGMTKDTVVLGKKLQIPAH